MTRLRVSLVIFSIVIFVVTIAAVAGHGVLWPKTFFSDLLVLNWRSQFNTDLVIHLGLMGWWVAWREGFSTKGYIYGVFCVIWGGMFTFPYVLMATYKAGGKLAEIFLGVNVWKLSSTSHST